MQVLGKAHGSAQKTLFSEVFARVRRTRWVERLLRDT